MNNTYLIKEKDLKTALDQIDSFQDKMELFSDKYPKYNYNININQKNKEWLVKLNIKIKDEQTNTQTS